MKKIILSLSLILVINFASNAQIFGEKKDVNGAEGYLNLRPDSVRYTGNDGNNYYFFYDLSRRTIFVTYSEEIFKDIRNHMAAYLIEGNRVKLQGPVIKALTSLFTKEQKEEEEKRMDIKLKKYKVARVMNYGLLTKNSK